MEGVSWGKKPPVKNPRDARNKGKKVDLGLGGEGGRLRKGKREYERN